MGKYNFTKFYQNQKKNKKVLLIARFFSSEFQSVSRIVKIVHSGYGAYHHVAFYLFQFSDCLIKTCKPYLYLEECKDVIQDNGVYIETCICREDICNEKTFCPECSNSSKLTTMNLTIFGMILALFQLLK